MRAWAWLVSGCLACWISTSGHALELNQANVAELDSLRGMGPALSAQVLAEREHKAFDSWADFRARVSGIGPAKIKQFAAQGLTINGQSLNAP